MIRMLTALGAVLFVGGSHAPVVVPAVEAPRVAPSDPQQGVAAARADDDDPVRPIPFGVGERSAYEVRFGPIRVGSGSMEVVGTENIRGRDALHTVFRVKGGTFFYKVDDRFDGNSL